MTKKQLQRVRKLARKLEWRRVKSEQYRSCPHEYTTISDNRQTFVALGKMIRRHGESRPWRGQRFKYLTYGPYAIWWMSSIINRTYKVALDRGGWPRKKDRKRIKKRFWGGK